MVDIESDDPIPGDYSLICFGAVVVEARLKDIKSCAGMDQFAIKLSGLGML